MIIFDTNVMKNILVDESLWLEAYHSISITDLKTTIVK